MAIKFAFSVGTKDKLISGFGTTGKEAMTHPCMVLRS